MGLRTRLWVTVPIKNHSEIKFTLLFSKVLQECDNSIFIFQYVVDGQSKEAITQLTEKVCRKAGVKVDKFLNEISGLCESIVECCCNYTNVENPNIMSVIEQCAVCAKEMLNFQHDQG